MDDNLITGLGLVLETPSWEDCWDRITLEVQGTLGKHGKLDVCYVKLLRILERISHAAYKFELPDGLGNVHGIIYDSNLRQCLSDETLVIPLLESEVKDELQMLRNLSKT